MGIGHVYATVTNNTNMLLNFSIIQNTTLSTSSTMSISSMSHNNTRHKTQLHSFFSNPEFRRIWQFF